MILLDTSAWILMEGGEVDLGAYLADEEAAICPAVYQEVLQGISDSRRYLRTRSTLLQTVMLDAPVPLARYEEAARLYIRCRGAAYTIRRSTDCLIAACAIAHGLTLVHDDRDFDFIAEVAPLKAQRV